MGLFTYRMFSLVTVLVAMAGLGSGVRIESNPEPYTDRSDKLAISCITDEPTYVGKTVLSIEIMMLNKPTLVALNNRQQLKKGSGMKDNMKAEGSIDTADGSKSRLTLTIEKPGIPDSGSYRCKVFYTDDSFFISEDDVVGKVTYKGCQDGWTFYKGDQTCLKAFGQTRIIYFLNWSKARQACRKFGGDLVIIRDADKNKFVTDLFKGSEYNNPWIGAKNYNTEGFKFKYVDGTDLGSFHPWMSGNPRGGRKGEGKCMTLTTSYFDNGQWYDYHCFNAQPYVCSTK